jgi:hypothetical protein
MSEFFSTNQTSAEEKKEMDPFDGRYRIIA